jgi:hypothetical protein
MYRKDSEVRRNSGDLAVDGATLAQVRPGKSKPRQELIWLVPL